MRCFAFATLLALLQACSTAPPPTLMPSPGPEEPTAASSEAPYRPVMAGTVYHGLGKTP